MLGLGEAGTHFANDLAKLGVIVHGFDPNPIRELHPTIQLAKSNAEAVQNVDVIFSANLSSVSEDIALEIAPFLNSKQFFCEMNTSSPEKKKSIGAILQPTHVKFIDLAIMAPVPPKGILTPFLAAGEYSQEFLKLMQPLNLTISIIENGKIGDAATRKLLRSIIYKGFAAVICEAVEAGERFYMPDYIRKQIRSIIGGNDELIDRFVEGSKTHALRRMHEMDAVIEMLEEKGLDPIVTRGTRENLQKLEVESRNTTLTSERRGKDSIPYYHFRGGSSKGLFFQAKDLPKDEGERNTLLLLAMEGATEGDSRQIGGLGGGSSLTSKVAIVSPSQNPDADLDYYFVQVVLGKGRVSTTQTCGNILAGVLPFAIETGMITPNSPITTAKINIVNTGGFCEVIVQTPNHQVNYKGDVKIDGVVGTAAPIVCNYLDTVGATCGSLLPTGHSKDTVENIEVTCIDNGMPLVLMRAADFGLIGNEHIADLEADESLKTKIEQIRLKAGFLMNLGDVKQQTIPKMCLISPPQKGGVINTRMFIPHVVHEAIGVLAAVSVATACVIPNTVAVGISRVHENQHLLSIEHPSGEFTVNISYQFVDNKIIIKESGVIRTAKLIAKGQVYL